MKCLQQTGLNYKISWKGSSCAILISYGGLGLWQEMQALIEEIWTSEIMLGQ
jgi:hypothetical protein